MASLPDALDTTAPAAQGTRLRWESAEGLRELPAVLRLYEPVAPGFGVGLEIEPLAAPRRPDVLVYWSSDSQVSDQLPEKSYLVGRLEGARKQRFPLPPESNRRPGSMYLYSLGHQELVDAAALGGGS